MMFEVRQPAPSPHSDVTIGVVADDYELLAALFPLDSDDEGQLARKAVLRASFLKLAKQQ